MSKSIVIKVDVIDDDANEVCKSIIQIYDGSYGYEVEKMLTALGARLAKIVDPHHDGGDESE